jgi:hypothetical protein
MVSGFGVRFGFLCMHDMSTHDPQGYHIQPSGFLVSGFWFRVSGFGFRVSGFGFRVQGFGFRVSGLGFRDDMSHTTLDTRQGWDDAQADTTMAVGSDACMHACTCRTSNGRC